MTEQAVTLYSDIQDVVQGWNSLGHTPESTLTTFPSLEESNAVSAAADKVIDITACVACLYELTGVPQKEQSQAMLDIAACLPNPLLEKLRDIVGKELPPPASAVKRRRRE